MHFHQWKCLKSVKLSLKFVTKGPIDKNSALVQVMAWHWTGDKPLPHWTQVHQHIYAALGWEGMGCGMGVGGEFMIWVAIYMGKFQKFIQQSVTLRPMNNARKIPLQFTSLYPCRLLSGYWTFVKVTRVWLSIWYMNKHILIIPFILFSHSRGKQVVFFNTDTTWDHLVHQPGVQRNIRNGNMEV